MLHLRVVCPPERTTAVVDLLKAQPGATHLIVLPGVAVAPEGDVVEADVAREAADEVIEQLCAIDLDHLGAITVEQIDTAVSDAADEAMAAAPGEGADAVVWQELLTRTGEESRLNGTFLGFITIACLLAGVAVVTDSTVTLVGAMVVGPEFGPLAAMAVGMVRRRWDLVSRAAVALAVGFPVAMLITAGGTLLAQAGGLLDVNAVRSADNLDFVYDVGVFSLIVALLAGAAGMLSMTSSKSAALVGVFISVTTIPAAGYAAVAAVLGEWQRCLYSFGQLVVNLIGVVLAAGFVLLVRKRTWTSQDNGRPLSTG
ncbi:DUF389 domain-containing protein [Kibdelosporangium persicum]|uniref:DUF389 domain-containing protein n=1 Tax=Kibdelosporangium persicum TaxID=2698649 RepID=A0ABX2EZF6_9PSEU|nr:DUF389 domain-containing protein [Kibdelosporangium persicum]NRN64357.1 DUF389 domain-containing protein [Kibdelosporangium persicum]